MVQVKPNQNLPIAVHLFNGATGKVVKGKVKKLDGTVLTTLTLNDIGDGSYAHNTFPMPAGTEFVTIEFIVYLTGGVTVDLTYSQFSQEYGVIFPIIASTLQFVAICAEDDSFTQPKKIKSVKTSDLSIKMRMLNEDGSPLDITGATGLSFKLKKTDGTALTKDLTLGVAISDAKGGESLVTLLAADLTLCDEGTNSVEVQLNLGGQVHVRILDSILELQESLFVA